MANGRSNFGFNVTGGSGGLANLVQAPKVTPARALSFAPTPRRIQRDEKDPKKQILGALLGASSPFLAEAGLAGLAKISGLEDKVENCIIHHAGTKYDGLGNLLSNGGRVLAITGVSNSLYGASVISYKFIQKIGLEGSHYRKDIGYRSL